MSLMSRPFRVTLPLICAFLLFVAQGSPTYAQTGSISCENFGTAYVPGFNCTMTVSGTTAKISAILWTGIWGQVLRSGNQLGVHHGSAGCGKVFDITGEALELVDANTKPPTYSIIATASINYLFTCSSRTSDEGSQSTSTEEDEAPTSSKPPVLVELDGIAATPQSIREDADEPVVVTLTISLKESSKKDEAVSLAIVSPAEGRTAKRDEDFTATLPETITIPAGTIKATAQMTVQPKDNTTADGDKAFAVQATSPDGYQALINIQIIDNDVELDGIAATPRSIREDADEPVAVTLTISLKKSSKKDEAVSLAIVSPAKGKTAKRDEDFTATLPETITIPAGTIKATAQMTVQPKDNTTAADNKAFAVQATSPSGHRALINIRIIDNDVELDGIAAAPQSIREDADEPVTVTLTISLRRSSRKDEAVALAIVSPTVGKTAKRDEDFTATLPETITIPAGTIKATAQMTVQPQDNTTADGNKAFAVQATSPSGHRALANIQIIDDEAANTTASAGEDSATPDEGEDSGEDSAATFAFASAVEDQAYTAGTAITALMLPEATDGQGAITYRVLGLPAGLTFDAATRIVSGTPTKATDEAVEVAYLAQDSAGRGITLTFSITVNSALSFGDLFK